MLLPASPILSNKDAPCAMLLIRSGRVATAMLESEFGKFGLTVPYATILMALLDHGPKTATDLCVLTMRERANMSVLLSKLRRTGYVEESANPLDARSQLENLTDKGKSAAMQCKTSTEAVSTEIDQYLEAQNHTAPRFREILVGILTKYPSLHI